jgi:hypothetical protein
MQTMPDYHLDALFRSALAAEAETLAPSAADEEQMLQRVRQALTRRRSRRQIATLLIAAALVSLTAGAIALATDRLRPPVTPEPPLASEELVPSGSPLPSPSARDEVVHNWPDTTENPAGLYAWGGGPSCGPTCNIGYMHNGYGSADLVITMSIVPEGSVPDDDGDAVTLAGHDAIYTRIDARTEEWIVDIEGTTVAIRLTTRPGTSDADLAEAQAIIDSMYTEPTESAPYGWRLFFRLATDDWDSG